MEISCNLNVTSKGYLGWPTLARICIDSFKKGLIVTKAECGNSHLDLLDLAKLLIVKDSIYLIVHVTMLTSCVLLRVYHCYHVGKEYNTVIFTMPLTTLTTKRQRKDSLSHLRSLSVNGSWRFDYIEWRWTRNRHHLQIGSWTFIQTKSRQTSKKICFRVRFRAV